MNRTTGFYVMTQESVVPLDGTFHFWAVPLDFCLPGYSVSLN